MNVEVHFERSKDSPPSSDLSDRLNATSSQSLRISRYRDECDAINGRIAADVQLTARRFLCVKCFTEPNEFVFVSFIFLIFAKCCIYIDSLCLFRWCFFHKFSLCVFLVLRII